MLHLWADQYRFHLRTQLLRRWRFPQLKMLLVQSVVWLRKVTNLWCDLEVKFLSDDYTNPKKLRPFGFIQFPNRSLVFPLMQHYEYTLRNADIGNEWYLAYITNALSKPIFFSWGLAHWQRFWTIHPTRSSIQMFKYNKIQQEYVNFCCLYLKQVFIAGVLYSIGRNVYSTAIYYWWFWQHLHLWLCGCHL